MIQDVNMPSLNVFIHQPSLLIYHESTALCPVPNLNQCQLVLTATATGLQILNRLDCTPNATRYNNERRVFR